MQHNDEYLRQVHLKKCGSENSEAVSGQRAAPQISGGKDKTRLAVREVRIIATASPYLNRGTS